MLDTRKMESLEMFLTFHFVFLITIIIEKMMEIEATLVIVGRQLVLSDSLDSELENYYQFRVEFCQSMFTKITTLACIEPNGFSINLFRIFHISAA